MDIQKILKLFAENNIAIGSITDSKDAIENHPLLWMDISNTKKNNFFIKTVEEDDNFSEIVLLTKNFSGGASFIEDSVNVNSLMKATSKIDLFLRFIAMAYVGLKIGLKGDEKGKEVDVIGCYRISSYELNDYRQIAKSFSLNEMMYSWDGETALCRPIIIKDNKLEKVGCVGYWDFEVSGWNAIIEYYLLEKEKIISPMEIKGLLSSLLKKDEELLKVNHVLHPILKSILAVDNLYLINEKKISEIVEILESYNVEQSFKSQDKIVIVQDFSGPHITKGWDVRIKSSIVHMFANGKMYRYEFDPYYEYEDYEGGETFRRERFHAQKILSVADGLSVVVKMNNGSELPITLLEKFSFVRKRKKGKKEKWHDDCFRLKTRLTYEGNPQDLNFDFQNV